MATSNSAPRRGNAITNVIKQLWGSGLRGKVTLGCMGLIVFLCLCSVFGNVRRALTPPSQAATPSAKQTAAGISVTVHTVYADPRNAPATPTVMPVEAVEATEADIPAPPTVEPEPSPTNQMAVPAETPAMANVPFVSVKEGNDFVNVRSGPGTNYDLLGTLNAGQTALVKGKSEDITWWQIEYANGPNGVGWVFGDLVVFTGDAQGVLVAAAIPPPQASVAVADTPQPVDVAPTQAPAPSGCNCNVSDYNCDDFSTHAKAQACYNQCGGNATNNLWGLDRDGDGVVCENRP
ncbi:MAG: SH3 domain-containing protein [Chloroflexi bacterium]|nr:SH3 domain-containing protein [Chloroflexota bacterium]